MAETVWAETLSPETLWGETLSSGTLMAATLLDQAATPIGERLSQGTGERPDAGGAAPGGSQPGRVRVAVIWIDWYAYHVARFAGLCRHPALAGAVAGIELVGGIGVHAGLQFRSALPPDLPVVTLFPAAGWAEAGQWPIARRLWQALSSLDPEVILVPGYYTLPGIAAALWARVHGRKSVLMTESTEGDHVRAAWKEKAKSLLLRGLFGWAIAGGAPHVRYLQALGFPLSRVKRFYDVVDNDGLARQVELLRQASGSGGGESAPASSPYFLYIGRLAPEKNVAGLLAAWEAYRAEGGSWPLVLVGDGPEGETLRAQAARSAYAAAIHFAGHTSSAALTRFFAFAGCFVLPSTREPWGLVVNEAMACGLPVLASTRCGCVEDLLREGITGWSFDPESTRELAALLATVQAMGQEEWTAMRRRAREHIAHYSPARFAEEIAAIAAATD